MTTEPQGVRAEPDLTHVLVIGALEAARVTCALFVSRGHRVTHLVAPTDVEVRQVLTTGMGRPEAVVVIVRSDIQALRYALLTEHERPGIDLVVSLFDRTVAEQLAHVVPHCATMSPAATAAASIVAGVSTTDGLCLVKDASSRSRYAVITRPEGSAQDVPTREWRAPGSRWSTRLSSWLPRPTTGASGLFLVGMSGLLAILLVDWVLSVFVLHEGVLASLFAATRVVATVGPADPSVVQHAPGWYLVLASLFMIAAIVFTGVFVAGLVDWLLSTRSVALVGRRAVPRRDHVIVAGLGQVGLRACLMLRSLGVPVVAIERNPQAPQLRLARDAGIPVLVGHADDRAMMDRVNLHRALGLAALGSDELDNVAVSIAARAVAPQARIVLRAGEDEVVAETRSLFRIGTVIDVPALMAASAVLAVDGVVTRAVFADDSRVGAVTAEGLRWFRPPMRCTC